MNRKKIGFTIACVNEFAQQHNLSIQEAFRYLFNLKVLHLLRKIMMWNIHWTLQPYWKIWESCAGEMEVRCEIISWKQRKDRQY